MSRLRFQQGVGLIEVMISALVMAIGLLGILGMQTRSLQLSHQSFVYNQATLHAQDIAERIRANGDAVDAYLIDFGESRGSEADTCLTTSCSEEDLAKWDLTIWKSNLAASLPQGEGSIVKLGDQIIVTVRFDGSNGEEELQSISFAMQI